MVIPDNEADLGLILISDPFFILGQVVMTRGAADALDRTDIVGALKRHVSGDWGDVCTEDQETNDEALKQGFRLLSSYTAINGTKFWIITEADRSVTTLLLPHEY